MAGVICQRMYNAHFTHVLLAQSRNIEHIPDTNLGVTAIAAMLQPGYCVAASQLIKCKPDSSCSYHTSRAVSLKCGPVGAFSVPEHFSEAGYCWFCFESTTMGFSLDLHRNATCTDGCMQTEVH